MRQSLSVKRTHLTRVQAWNIFIEIGEHRCVACSCVMSFKIQPYVMRRGHLRVALAVDFRFFPFLICFTMLCFRIWRDKRVRRDLSHVE
jgi:hypothetical protein